VSGCDNRVMTAHPHSILEVVELRTDSGRWPAGTIVEADEAVALVEVVDEGGHALDFVSLPHDALAPARDRAVPAGAVTVPAPSPGRLGYTAGTPAASAGESVSKARASNSASVVRLLWCR